jgi:ABC-2 type transport system ATP-binding protein
VLRGIDLEAAPGRITAYLGPNGAGKSTTIKILLGIVRDYQGSVKVFGEEIRGAPVAFRSRIGYVPEVSDLYEALSGEEYLLFLARIHGLPENLARRRMRDMAAVLGLADDLESRIGAYSKGMRQKLMIIASLLHDPDLLFWDEPLSGLDANTALVIKELLGALARQGKTIFYSSHVMEVVEKISDRILILNGGRIVADGSFAELRAQSQALNLEALFNNLTGHEDQAVQAQALVDAMQDGRP